MEDAYIISSSMNHLRINKQEFNKMAGWWQREMYHHHPSDPAPGPYQSLS
jgi:hypothetical protein